MKTLRCRNSILATRVEGLCFDNSTIFVSYQDQA
jgi:hypothetical protein